MSCLLIFYHVQRAMQLIMGKMFVTGWIPNNVQQKDG